MKFENILIDIEKIESNIFEYNTNIIIKELLSLISVMYDQMVNLNKEELNKVNKILNYINVALENKDYLFLADLLTYELKSIILEMR
ncbi:MAG: hypothetical protein Q8900_01060 [Bacillota bacterium]|nr:hypothetical protein [Bacillota bacterium]